MNLIIGPLEWNKDIFYNINIENCEVVIFDNIESVESKVKQIEIILKKNKSYNVHVFSYGGAFLNYMLQHNADLQYNINKIYFYDAINLDNKYNLEEIINYRCATFNTIEQIYVYYQLDKNEINDSKLTTMILKQYNYKNNTYTHFLNDVSFSKYLNIKFDSLFFLKLNIDYKIYSSVILNDLEYIKINEDDHLMMLTLADEVNNNLRHANKELSDYKK